MTAIYQRARPIHWDEVVGQEHVKDVLRAALERGRVGHAYLFSGPRGVGKTTTARLIAMTANCERGGVKPCGECSSCLMVRSGSHPDVMEIDAASNNSVDDVRELREKVGLAAMRGGKKIYILDEAHMMSRAAFNALLKTLEEPPSHVVFVLATTEPEKILPTILSRCQHYRFRRLSDTEIAGKLMRLCQTEGVNAEPEALALIGRLADGAMRDGESLLERMLAAGGDVTRTGVEAALGLPPSERMTEMARALAVGDEGPLLTGAGQLYREGFAARTVVDGLKTALRDAVHAALGLGTGTRIDGVEVPRLLRLQAALDDQDSRFARAADLMSLELALTHALLAGDGAGAAPEGARPGGTVPADVAARLSRIERDLAALRSARPEAAPDAGDASRRPAAAPARAASTGTAAPVASSETSAAPQAPRVQGSWPDVMALAVKKRGMQLRAFLKEGRFEQDGRVVRLVFDKLDKSGKPGNKFHGQGVIAQIDSVAEIVREVFGPVAFEVVSFGETKTVRAPGASASEPQDTPAPPTSSPVGQSAGEVAREVVRQIGTAQAVQTTPIEAQPIQTSPAQPARAQTVPAEVPRAAPARSAPSTSASSTPNASPRPATAPAVSDDIPDFSPARGRPASRPSPATPAPDQTTSGQRSPEPRTPPAPADDAAPGEPVPWESAPPVTVRPAGTAPKVAPPLEIYDPEPIFEEPVWDDGPSVESVVTASAVTPPNAAPSEGVAAPRIAPPVETNWDGLGQDRALPRDAEPDAGEPTTTTALAAPPPVARGAGQTVRAHPLFQEATRLFSGRVREAGVSKKARPAPVEEADPELAELVGVDTAEPDAER